MYNQANKKTGNVININDKTYLSGTMTDEPGNDTFIRLNMKPYDPTLQKVTQFFTNWDPTALLHEITKALE